MKISMIVAADLAGGIGFENKIPWKLSSDMKFFKDKTTNNAVVMGHNTFKSIGKALPNRHNFVLTTGTPPNVDEVIFFSCIEDATEAARNLKVKELFIIGGATLYNKYQNLADTLYLTLVDATITADTLFIKDNDWVLADETEWQQGPKDQFRMKFQIYKK